MAPTAASTPVSRPSKSVPKTAPTRTTRQRAAKDNASTPGARGGLLAKTTESLRKVSDKIKDKESSKKAGSILPAGAGESLQAFLRIRPAPSEAEPNHRPYLELQNEQDVLLRAPLDPLRPHVHKPPVMFSFNRAFSSEVPQASFFTSTTLPLVENLLGGQNGLMFAYGVSNSGKTYTIAGGRAEAEARGVLPRSIDVVFNSIKGLESQQRLRCQGVADVEICEASEERCAPFCADFGEPSSSESVKVDRNFSYAVFVSYAEVYNEKIFDLLESVLPVQDTSHVRTPGPDLHRSNSIAFNSTMSLAAMVNGGAGVLKRQALALKNDTEGNGKYISGLKELRVRTREEALAIFRAGQRARQVFGTLANRESSRSHGIFTIKVVRIHNGDPTHPDSAQVSRLSIVDLAGSERTKNTGTTGDRLKEAGNINKSLMVLGQCMEVMRCNQQKIAAAAAAGKNAKKKLDVVPFRHSKLTEIFQSFFVGDGRAVMIINVNPYDTGYDENSHVMRFSAVAREVQVQHSASAQTNKSFPLLRRQISTQFSAFKQAVAGPMRIKVVVPVPAPAPAPASTVKVPTARLPSTGTVRINETETVEPIEMGSSIPGYMMVEQELEVVEEAEESENDDSDEEEGEGKDWLVEYLFEQITELKTQLYESEMRNASVEVKIREEVANEWAERLAKVQADHLQRFQQQLLASEMKTDRKLDILSRSMTPAVAKTARFKERSLRENTVDSSLPDDSFASAASVLTGKEDMSIDSAASAPRDERSGGRDSDVFLAPSSQNATTNSAVPEAVDLSTESADVLAHDLSDITLDPQGDEGQEGTRDRDNEDEDEAMVEDLAAVYDDKEDELSPDSESEDEEDEEDDVEAEDKDQRSGDTGDEEEDLDFEQDAKLNGGWHTNSEDEGSVSDPEDDEEASDDDENDAEEDESDFEASEDEESEEEVLPARTARKGRVTGQSQNQIGRAAHTSAATSGTKATRKSPTTRSDETAGPAEKPKAKGNPRAPIVSTAADSKKTPAIRAKAGIDMTGGSPNTPVTPVSGPLRERNHGNQATGSHGEEEDDEESPFVPKSRKKRTLGKKVNLEDDMELDENRPVRAGEVRRLIPSSARKSGF